MEKLDNFKFFLLENATLVGEYGIPLVEDNISSLPTTIVPFNIAMQMPIERRKEVWVHFYIDDYQFERIWNKPIKYLEILKQFKGVIAPNFSMFANMPKAISIFNLYRNNTLCNFYMQNSIEVIPCACWTNASSHFWCLETIEKNSIVSVSSVGADKEMFIQGFHLLMKIVNPRLVVYLGQIFDEIKEYTDKIILFEPYIKKLHNFKKGDIINGNKQKCK